MSQIKQTIQAMHRRDTLNMLFWLGWLLIVGEIFISVRFQLLFATTPDEQAVAVLYGIGIPLATVAFFKLSIIFHDKRFMLAAFSLFLLLFFWGWHTQYSYLLNETDTKDNSGRVSVIQNEHLKTLDERLKNLPVVGAVFQDSSDSQIKALEEQLSRCPNGQTTVCKKPLMEKIEALQIKRERNGTAAMVHQERDSILKEKDRALRSMTGLDADMENAKVMSVYKGISWMVNKMGGNCSPKEAEYLASIIGTFLYTVLSCGIWGFRTKLIMESSEESPARFDRVNYQAENTDAEEARLWNRVQNAAPVYRQRATQAVGGIRERLQAAISNRQPVTPTAQMNSAAVVNENTVPQSLINAVNAQNDMRRGMVTTFDNFDDDVEFDATTAPRRMTGMGFMGEIVPSPENAGETAATTPENNRPAVVGCSQETTPAVVNQLQQATTETATTSANAGNLSGRSAAALVSYDDIKQAVVDGKIPVVSIRKLIDYTRSISTTGTGIGDRMARKIISMLKDDGIINLKNEVL